MGAQRETHERLTSDEAARGASDRGFGLVFAVVFAIIGLWPLIGDGPVRIWACVVGTCFLAVAVTRPRILAPLNRLWTGIGLFLHRIASFVVLWLLFRWAFDSRRGQCGCAVHLHDFLGRLG